MSWSVTLSGYAPVRARRPKSSWLPIVIWSQKRGAYQPVGASMHPVGCERAHDGDAKVAFKAPSSTSRLPQRFGRTAH